MISRTCLELEKLAAEDSCWTLHGTEQWIAGQYVVMKLMLLAQGSAQSWTIPCFVLEQLWHTFRG